MIDRWLKAIDSWLWALVCRVLSNWILWAVVCPPIDSIDPLLASTHPWVHWSVWSLGFGLQWSHFWRNRHSFWWKSCQNITTTSLTNNSYMNRQYKWINDSKWVSYDKWLINGSNQWTNDYICGIGLQRIQRFSRLVRLCVQINYLLFGAKDIFSAFLHSL